MPASSAAAAGGPRGCCRRPPPPPLAQEVGQHLGGAGGRVGEDLPVARPRGEAVVHGQRAQRADLAGRRVARRPRRHPAEGVEPGVVADDLTPDLADPGLHDGVGQPLERREQGRLAVKWDAQALVPSTGSPPPTR